MKIRFILLALPLLAFAAGAHAQSSTSDQLAKAYGTAVGYLAFCKSVMPVSDYQTARSKVVAIIARSMTATQADAMMGNAEQMAAQACPVGSECWRQATGLPATATAAEGAAKC